MQHPIRHAWQRGNIIWVEMNWSKECFILFYIANKEVRKHLEDTIFMGSLFSKVKTFKMKKPVLWFFGFYVQFETKKILGYNPTFPSVKDTKTQSPDILYETWTYRLIRFILHQWVVLINAFTALWWLWQTNVFE